MADRSRVEGEKRTASTGDRGGVNNFRIVASVLTALR
jgi:hypothetical protein